LEYDPFSRLPKIPSREIRIPRLPLFYYLALQNDTVNMDQALKKQKSPERNEEVFLMRTGRETDHCELSVAWNGRVEFVKLARERWSKVLIIAVSGFDHVKQLFLEAGARVFFTGTF
jgi:cobalamin biosynthesis Co2+ chelatase CbiK